MKSKRFISLLVRTTIVILVLLFSLYGAIRLPIVQNYVAQKVIDSFSERLQNEISFEKLKLEPFNQLTIQEALIKDRNGDTLVYTDYLNLDISLFSFFKKKLEITSINLDGSVIKLKEDSISRETNYQFLINEIEKDGNKENNSSSWEFDIKNVSINNCNLVFQSAYGYELESFIGNIDIDVQQLDVKSKIIKLDEILIDDSTVSIGKSESNKKEKSYSYNWQLPQLGWGIEADKLVVDGSSFTLNDLSKIEVSSGFDINHFAFEEIEIELENISLNDNIASGKLNHLRSKEKSGFELKEMNADLSMTSSIIDLKHLKVKSNESNFEADAKMAFNPDDVSGLISAEPTIDINITKGSFSRSDIEKIIGEQDWLNKINPGSIIEIRGGIRSRRQEIVLDDSEIIIDETTKIDASGLYSIADNTFSLNLERVSSSINDLRSLIPEVSIPEYFNQFEASGNINGSKDGFSASNLVFNSPESGSFIANMTSENYLDPEKAKFIMTLSDLTLYPKVIKQFFPDSLDTYINSIGVIKYNGLLVASHDSIGVDGLLNADLGTVKIIADIDLDDEIENTDYHVDADLMGVNLKPFTEGKISIIEGNIVVDGKGLDKQNMVFDWKASLPVFAMADINYSDIDLKGKYSPDEITASGLINDEYFRSEFDGCAKLNDDNKELILNADISNVDFDKIGLSKIPISGSGQVLLNMSGNSIDDIIGDIKIKDWNLKNDSVSVSGNEMILKSMQTAGGENKIELVSDYINGYVEGNYILSDLPADFISFIDGYFPINTNSISNQKGGESSTSGQQDLSFNVTSDSLGTLAKLLDPNIKNAGALEFSGSINTDTHDMVLDFTLDDLVYNNTSINQVEIITSSAEDRIDSKVSFGDIRIDSKEYQELTLQFTMGDEKIDFDIDLEGDQKIRGLTLAGTLSHNLGTYDISLDPYLILNDKKWSIDSENKISISNSDVDVKKVVFIKEDQKISIQSFINKNAPSNTNFDIKISDFRISEISSLGWQSAQYFDGLLHTDIQIYNVGENPFFRGEFHVDNSQYKDQVVGDFNFDFDQNENEGIITILGKLKGKENDVNLKGSYDPKTNNIAGDLELIRLDAIILETLLEQEASIESGHASGVLNVSGPLDKLKLRGQVTMEDLTSEIAMTKTKYNIPKVRIDFVEDKIKFKEFQLVDEEENISRISGNVFYSGFENFNLDFVIDSDELLVLDTEENADQLYFGKLIVAATAKLTGRPGDFKIEVNAKTLKGTNLTLVSQDLESAAVRDRFIIFGHPDDYVDSIAINERMKFENSLGINLIANLEVSPEATINIILDPVSKDEINCIGESNLVFEMNSAGDVTILGNYIFKEGNYQFDYEGLVKKNFTIGDGSSLNFLGQPEESLLNIQALYSTKTTTYNLINTQSTLSEEERKEANESTEINVILNILGSMEAPKLSFQISVPKAEEGRLGNVISRKLTELNDNPDELNRQVFGILFFNSFISENQVAAAESVTQSVEMAAFSSFSSLMTNQLNSVANQIIKGVDISFDMDSYNAGVVENSVGVVTEVGVSVSKKLLNDRLSIKVGSNVNINRENATSWSNVDFSTIAGDFILEYRLNEKGNYLVRIFHLNDYDIIQDENDYKTGVGFVIRKKLND
jgi:hypothetical protein